MGNFSVFHLLFVGLFIFWPLVLFKWLVSVAKGEGNDETANTWKFRTVVFTLLAFMIPPWIITLPVLLYCAYVSYTAGKHGEVTPSFPNPQAQWASPVEMRQTTPAQQASSMTQAIAELHKLLQQGALTQEEFDQEKKKLLSQDRKG